MLLFGHEPPLCPHITRQPKRLLASCEPCLYEPPEHAQRSYHVCGTQQVLRYHTCFAIIAANPQPSRQCDSYALSLACAETVLIKKIEIYLGIHVVVPEKGDVIRLAQANDF